MSIIERSRASLRPAVGGLALAVALALTLPAHAQTWAQTWAAAGDAARGEMCWSPEGLAPKEGEARIRRAGRPVIEPPQRSAITAQPIPVDKRLPIRRVKLRPGLKLVALTFDLCEQPYEVAGYQGEIVDYLRVHGVKATFFAGGKWMLTHEQRAQQLMADPLFEVGNHSWEHRNLRLLDGASLVGEIEGPQAAYEQVREDLARRQCLGRDARRPAYQQAPQRISLFRFPFGACNAQALEAVGAMGLRAIQWDVSSGDPAPAQESEHMARTVLSAVRPGSIVLFHANGRGWHTPAALPAIVEELKARGYRFATVSELLASGTPEYAASCYDSRPGDTDRYDAFAQHLETLYERWRSRVSSGQAVGRSKIELNQEP
jgi:peptidoglycan/xylan/chitin deacetylase (PgdA/CDA1 family)